LSLWLLWCNSWCNSSRPYPPKRDEKHFREYLKGGPYLPTLSPQVEERHIISMLAISMLSVWHPQARIALLQGLSPAGWTYPLPRCVAGFSLHNSKARMPGTRHDYRKLNAIRLLTINKLFSRVCRSAVSPGRKTLQYQATVNIACWLLPVRQPRAGHSDTGTILRCNTTW
jgi:hypothetical protein